ASLVWAAVSSPEDLAEIGTAFFLTVVSTWSVLVPAKIWPMGGEDSGSRRALQMLLGLGIGLAALWLDYGSEVLPGRFSWAVPSPSAIAPLGEGLKLPVAAGSLGYFGLAFFAMRWWKLADRYRASRFSLGPVLGAAFWAAVLIGLAPVKEMAVSVVLTAIIVQLVSP